MTVARPPQLAIVDIIGRDAVKIVNNLCTADIAKLPLHFGREAFVTDVRGKTLGHVCIYRFEDRLRLIGAAASTSEWEHAEAIIKQVDRYTIREDATAVNVSEHFEPLLVAPPAILSLDLNAASPIDLACGLWPSDSSLGPIADSFYAVPWWDEPAVLLLAQSDAAQAFETAITQLAGTPVAAPEFHRRRVAAFFPWFGVDLDPNNLPQEADRDAKAISFTKGCYLGQETVARLDALGQVQKKLVKWKVACSSPVMANTELKADERVVGRLASVVPADEPNHWDALGFARRTHFEPGSTASGISESGDAITATVVPHG